MESRSTPAATCTVMPANSKGNTHKTLVDIVSLSPSHCPEITLCPCCGSHSDLLVKSRDHNRKITDAIFCYWECRECGMVFMDAIPENIGDYYAGGYQQIPENFSAFVRMADAENYRLEPLLRYKVAGDLLEIGPWIGIFSFNAMRRGFSVDAIEMSPAACEFLREQVKISVENTHDVVGALERSSKSYDAIVLWHSLEHLPKPWLVIRKARQRLKRDGVLIVAIPNISGSQAGLLGDKWLHLDAPRHTHFWSPDALTKLGRRSGLKLLEMTTRDRLSRTLGTMAWQHRIRTAIGIPVVRRVIGVLLAPMLTLLLSRKGGAGITAVFGIDHDDAPQRAE
jgi:2-polyprenyl-3-methyl-5-hydroxy-6-metoxy-1,4-benzoquinol methylase